MRFIGRSTKPTEGRGLFFLSLRIAGSVSVPSLPTPVSVSAINKRKLKLRRRALGLPRLLQSSLARTPVLQAPTGATGARHTLQWSVYERRDLKTLTPALTRNKLLPSGKKLGHGCEAAIEPHCEFVETVVEVFMRLGAPRCRANAER
jgi:hypothetical protein